MRGAVMMATPEVRASQERWRGRRLQRPHLASDLISGGERFLRAGGQRQGRRRFAKS